MGGARRERGVQGIRRDKGGREEGEGRENKGRREERKDYEG
jgi:hypothetical protein